MDLELEKLGFIETICKIYYIVKVIVFIKTPLYNRDNTYYQKMTHYILNSLSKQHIYYDHLNIDWAPQSFGFIPKHNHHSYKGTFYHHIYEPLHF